MPRARAPAKFIQILCCADTRQTRDRGEEGGLYALDKNGVVWKFNHEENFWQELSSTRR